VEAEYQRFIHGAMHGPDAIVIFGFTLVPSSTPPLQTASGLGPQRSSPSSARSQRGR
jgi:hypothetical protein